MLLLFVLSSLSVTHAGFQAYDLQTQLTTRTLGQHARELQGFRTELDASEPDLPFRISGSSCAEKQLHLRTRPGPPPTHVMKEER